ncbi:unnamed protein product, partial [Nesidiocoris tenuis]
MLWKYCEYFKFERAIGRAKTNVPVSSKNRILSHNERNTIIGKSIMQSLVSEYWIQLWHHSGPHLSDLMLEWCSFNSEHPLGKAAPDGVELITGSFCFGIIRYCQGPDGAVLPSWRCSKFRAQFRFHFCTTKEAKTHFNHVCGGKSDASRPSGRQGASVATSVIEEVTNDAWNY